jgi:hypothetical protein
LNYHFRGFGNSVVISVVFIRVWSLSVIFWQFDDVATFGSFLLPISLGKLGQMTKNDEHMKTHYMPKTTRK